MLHKQKLKGLLEATAIFSDAELTSGPLECTHDCETHLLFIDVIHGNG